MLKKLFKKDFNNHNFMQELLQPNPKFKWLEESLTYTTVDINHVDENNNTPLMTMLLKSSYKSALWLIDNGADTTLKNKDGKGPIDIAIYKNQIEIVEELLKLKKLDIDQKDEYGRSLLQNIIVSGNHQMAKILIKCGANINTLDNKGKHILYDALSYGDPVFVRHLLTYKNIELNDIDKDGNTLMQHPQIEQDDTLAKDLLIAGADPTILNAKGESYLYKTALRGKEADDIIDIALAHGANVNAKTTLDNTIMMQLVLVASKLPAKNKKLRDELLHTVSKMLEHKGDINALDSKGESGLFNAVALRDESLIKFLLHGKINTNIQNPMGQTVLEYLVYDGMEYSNLIQLLLEYGIDPKLKNKDGQTVYEVLTNLILHKEGTLLLKDEHLIKLYDPDALYFNVVQLLLEHEKVNEGEKFILNLLDSTGDPLFFKPLMYDNFALFSLYTRYAINLHQLNKQHYNIFFAYVLRIFENNQATASICKNFQNNISSLISRKVDKDFKDSLGWTILHKVLATECNIKLFKILTDVVKFDYKITDNLGRTVIHNAVWHDNIEVIKIINKIAPGSINIEDTYGITPIYYAALLGHKILVSQFFDLGATITTKGPINIKAIKKFKPMLKNLEKLKIDVDDLALAHRMDSLIQEIERKFGV
ncbi:MAG: ankyrin repeat domain-containing protein [Arcobacteraceae bacterium]